MIPKFSVSFDPIEYRALLRILDVVGLRVQGAGPKTDALKLMLPTAVVDEDSPMIVELPAFEISALLGIARIACGINTLDDCYIQGENAARDKYDRLLASEAVLEALEKAHQDMLAAP